MNLSKIKDMFNTLNLVTEAMSLHANVEIIRDDKYMIRFAEPMGELKKAFDYIFLEKENDVLQFNISYLDENAEKRITAHNQVLDYVHKYNEAIYDIYHQSILLQKIHQESNSFPPALKKLQDLLNLCQKYKLETIKLESQRRNK